MIRARREQQQDLRRGGGWGRSLSRDPRARTREDDRRGVALIMALVMVVLMTAFAVEFNYSSEVKNLSSYHYRDNTRSYYLAKGGLRIYGMLLIFARQMEGNSMIAGMLSSFGIDIDGAAMMCRNVPFMDTAMLRFLTGTGSGSMNDEEKEGLYELLGMGGVDEDGNPVAPPAMPTAEQQRLQQEEDEERRKRQRGYIDETVDEGGTVRRKLMDFEGDFKVDCADESTKIDINGFASNTWAGRPLELHPTSAMLMGLMSREEYDPLFEERLKMERWELIGNIKDWVDPDDQRSGLWGGDEDNLYDDFEPRYRSKNARFDSLEELRLVAGITDEVFETFSPALSVHTKNFKVNVNSANPTMIRALLRAFTDPMIIPEPKLQEVVMIMMAERMFLPGPFRNADDFIARAERHGVVFTDPNARTALKGMVTTKSRVFRLTATGYVNDSTAVIEQVIRVNKSSIRVLEWRER